MCIYGGEIAVNGCIILCIIVHMNENTLRTE